MKATLITYMGSDLMVVNAARVSFNKTSEYEIIIQECPIRDSGIIETLVLSNKDKGLINFLAKHGHWTPFAHPQLQFHIKVPIFVANQLKRHQIGLALNEVSRRYVSDEPEFYWPREWRLRPDNIKQGSGDTVLASEETHNLNTDCQALQIKIIQIYNWMIEEKVAPEMARMILPQNMYTEWYWTGSLAAFGRICKQRLDSHAQSETREIAQQISDQIKPHFPVSWEALMKEGEY